MASDYALYTEFVPTSVQSDALRDKLIHDILYLLDSVDSEDKSFLIKRCIQQIDRTKFDLAKSLVLGDAYYREYLYSLSVEQLDYIMRSIHTPIQQGYSFQPKTINAIRYIFDGTQKNPSYAIDDAFKFIGDVLAKQLREEEDRQYKLANRDRPYRPLEKRELQKCTEPLASIFGKLLPKLRNQDHIRQFISIIRKTLNNPELPLYKLLSRLFFAASKLADDLENEGQIDAANQIRADLRAAGFTPPRSKPRPQNIPVSWFQKLKATMKNILGLQVRTNDPVFPKSKVLPLQEPIKPNTDIGYKYEAKRALEKLQELYNQVSKTNERHSDEDRLLDDQLGKSKLLLPDFNRKQTPNDEPPTSEAIKYSALRPR